MSLPVGSASNDISVLFTCHKLVPTHPNPFLIQFTTSVFLGQNRKCPVQTLPYLDSCRNIPIQANHMA
ncbi:hypothetical protein XELAEV_18040052mg [Xenopus laevis]|uniref:Uncharacterized protein n=1 Tax=Xenopus laevis TaxID=8355 RepID=A0A974H8L0_XENLA|nr:hypothetical protein XELAEV_18040052mg [Xenopus laevis]